MNEIGRALVEIASKMKRGDVVDAIDALREGLSPGDPSREERVIQLQAILLLEEALALQEDFAVDPSSPS